MFEPPICSNNSVIPVTAGLKGDSHNANGNELAAV